MLPCANTKLSERVQNLVQNAGHSPVFRVKIDEKGKKISNYMKIRGNRVDFMRFRDPQLGYKIQGLVRT